MAATKRLLVLMLALALMTPMAVMAAEGSGEEGTSDEAEDNAGKGRNGDRAGPGRDDGSTGNGSDDNDTEDDREDRRREMRERHEERMEEARERHEERMEEARERHEERMEEAHDRARDHRGWFYHFEEDNGTLSNGFVSFDVDEDLPGITNYTLGNHSIITRIALDGDDEARWDYDGPRFRMTAGHARLKALGTPGALLTGQAQHNTSLTLVLDPALNLSVVPLDADDDGDEVDEDENLTAPSTDGNQTIDANETGGNATAETNETNDEADEVHEAQDEADDEEDEERAYKLYRIQLPDNRTLYLGGVGLTHDNATLVLTDGVLHLRAAGGPDHDRPDGGDEAGAEDENDDEDSGQGRGRGRGQGRGRGHGGAALPLHNAARDRIEHALTTGQVGVEVYTDNGSDPVAVELGHVRVTGATAGANGSLARVDIEAPDDAPGTTVVLNLDPATVGNLTIAEAAQRLGVSFDGENISAADDLEDVLDWSDDGNAAEYLLLVGSDKVQVFVSVPHFSPHSVEVYQTQGSQQEPVDDGEEPASTPVPILATLAALAVAVRLRRR